MGGSGVELIDRTAKQSRLVQDLQPIDVPPAFQAVGIPPGQTVVEACLASRPRESLSAPVYCPLRLPNE